MRPNHPLERQLSSKSNGGSGSDRDGRRRSQAIAPRSSALTPAAITFHLRAGGGRLCLRNDSQVICSVRRHPLDLEHWRRSAWLRTSLGEGC